MNKKDKNITREQLSIPFSDDNRNLQQSEKGKVVQFKSHGEREKQRAFRRILNWGK